MHMHLSTFSFVIANKQCNFHKILFPRACVVCVLFGGWCDFFSYNNIVIYYHTFTGFHFSIF